MRAPSILALDAKTMQHEALVFRLLPGFASLKSGSQYRWPRNGEPPPGHAEAAAEASPPSLPIDTANAETGRSFAAAQDDEACLNQYWSIPIRFAVRVGNVHRDK